MTLYIVKQQPVIAYQWDGSFGNGIRNKKYHPCDLNVCELCGKKRLVHGCATVCFHTGKQVTEVCLNDWIVRSRCENNILLVMSDPDFKSKYKLYEGETS